MHGGVDDDGLFFTKIKIETMSLSKPLELQRVFWIGIKGMMKRDIQNLNENMIKKTVMIKKGWKREETCHRKI